MAKDWLTGSDRVTAGRQALLAAARAELLERGTSRFSVESVAERAGCSRATLYRLTGGRQALLDGVLADGAAEVARRVESAIAAAAGNERLVQAMVVGLRELRRDQVVHAWVRSSLRDGADLLASEDLSAVAGGWLEAGRDDPQLGAWILRIFLHFVAWPGADAASEEALIRRFVEPVLPVPSGAPTP